MGQKALALIFPGLGLKGFDSKQIERLRYDPWVSLQFFKECICLFFGLLLKIFNLNAFQREFGLKMVALVLNPQKYYVIEANDKV